MARICSAELFWQSCDSLEAAAESCSCETGSGRVSSCWWISPPTSTSTISTCRPRVAISSRCLKRACSGWGAVTSEAARDWFASTEAASRSHCSTSWRDLVELVADGPPGGRRQLGLLDQPADEIAVAFLGRDAPGGGVRLAQVTHAR